ncbi:MAG: bacteriochlorophyll/chlorophyll a synthase, partial [Beijerinckiaceae bacterium]|nr:bacteriochlorophyll/chlorophyll a synthase [Beijerinckiaceae bacterium]
LGGMPSAPIILLAFLYSFGAHGIMTLNDFKSEEGDAAIGIHSLPVLLGTDNAARLACIMMALPQAVVIALLALWSRPLEALAITALLIAQFVLMKRLLASPRAEAARYNATGTSLYVLGMMIAAIALRSASL